MEDDEIVVTGRRSINVEVVSQFDGRWGNLVPVWWAQSNHSAGVGGQQIQMVTEILDNGPKVFHPAGLNFDIVISQQNWNSYPAGLQKAITTLIANWQKSPSLSEALLHINQRGLAQLELDIGPVHNGGFAQIDYASDNNSGDRTQVTAGSTAKITFSEDRLATAANLGEEFFMNILAHELWHPKAPDINGFGSDHPLVEQKAREAVDEIYGLKPRAASSTVNDNGSAVLGSSVSDIIHGTDRNDALSGMAGNDYISGGLGSNILYGGVGSDTIVSSGVNDLLAGGAQADTYMLTITSISATIREESGFDAIEILGNISDYQFFIYGNNLEISGNNGSVGTSVIIEDFFVNGQTSAIERFVFGDGDYAASYINYLANGGSSVCYDEGGSVVFCSPYGMPIVVDLNGDGVHFRDAATSGVQLDVDGDGSADGVSWIANDDAFLVIDRNNNGNVDGFDEITFVYDMRGAGSDLEGLMGHDMNRDGFITAADHNFGLLKIWQDLNSNGVSEDGELKSLSDYGIESIDLEIFGRKQLDKDAGESQILGSSSMSGSGGSITIYDAALNFEKGANCGCAFSGKPSSDELVFESGVVFFDRGYENGFVEYIF